VWQYFLQHGAVERGSVTQGYFGSDPRLLEDYSGPASCLWSVRSLVAALALPDGTPFWKEPTQPLPVERGNYSITIPATGWTVSGSQSTGTITISTGRVGDPPLEVYSLLDRLRGLFSRLPHRPKNLAAKYGRASYDSNAPYGLDL
jgi:hypothetical protein